MQRTKSNSAHSVGLLYCNTLTLPGSYLHYSMDSSPWQVMPTCRPVLLLPVLLKSKTWVHTQSVHIQPASDGKNHVWWQSAVLNVTHTATNNSKKDHAGLLLEQYLHFGSLLRSQSNTYTRIGACAQWHTLVYTQWQLWVLSGSVMDGAQTGWPS